MEDQVKEALEIVGTFLRAHYHEVRWDIEGSTEVLNLWAIGNPYRKELSRGFRVIFSGRLPEDIILKLVQYEANRFVENYEEALQYLKDIYNDIHLDWEEDL